MGVEGTALATGCTKGKLGNLILQPVHLGHGLINLVTVEYERDMIRLHAKRVSVDLA